MCFPVVFCPTAGLQVQTSTAAQEAKREAPPSFWMEEPREEPGQPQLPLESEKENPRRKK